MAFNTKNSAEEPPVPEPGKKEPEQIIFDESENPMLTELSRKHPLRPPTFEMLLHPLRMATMVEPAEGAKLDFSMGLSQRLQLSNSLSLSHGKGGNYDITFMFAGGKLATPFEYVSPNPFMMARLSPSTGRQDIKFIYKPFGIENLEFKFSGNYMSFEPRESHVQLEAEYTGRDYIAGVKWGVGLEFVALSYIQSLTKNLVAGFEIMNMRRPRSMVNMSGGAKYSFGSTSLYMQHFAPSALTQLGAVIKGNSNITFSTELNYNGMEGSLEFLGGVSVRFMKAKLNAQFSGSGRLVSCLHHAINPFAKLTLTGEADFAKQEQKFGISLSIGDTSQ